MRGGAVRTQLKFLYLNYIFISANTHYLRIFYRARNTQLVSAYIPLYCELSSNQPISHVQRDACSHITLWLQHPLAGRTSRRSSWSSVMVRNASLFVYLHLTSARIHCIIVTLGGCGKTCLLIVYAENRFPEVRTPALTEPETVSLNSWPRICVNIVIYSHRVRELCHSSTIRGQARRTRTMGHGRTGRIRQITAVKLPRKRCHPDRVLRRLPRQSCERTG